MEEIHIMALNALSDSDEFKDRLKKYGTLRSDEWILSMQLLEADDVDEHYKKMYGKS